MTQLNVGVIGYGYWGPNLVRNFQENPDTKVAMVSDLQTGRLDLVRSRYPFVETSTDYHDLLNNPQIDAIVISTPVETHFDLAMAAFKAGKHVLVEKPLASSSAQVLQLIEEAEQRNLTLMVDHTFVYSGAVRKLRTLIETGELGDIYYYDSTRINLGLFRHDVNVIWDLAVHDLSIMDYLFQSKPCAVSATGIKHIPGELENVAYMTLFFDSSLIAHINVNWLAPVKVRRTLVGGSKKMAVMDDLEPSEKLKIYDTGVTLMQDRESIYQMLISYRTGDMLAPRLDMAEALKIEAQHFVDCVRTGKTPITDGKAGLRVIQMMEAATESMVQGGQRIDLPTGR